MKIIIQPVVKNCVWDFNTQKLVRPGKINHV